MPAIQSHFIEPIWEQFSALLPTREVEHPLGCHKPRISDKIVFEKLVQILVFGCAYHRIANESCSESTPRRRRDEWIEVGVMEALREMALVAYDRTIGLELTDIAVDGCIAKASYGGEKTGKSPVDRGKQGIKRSMAVDGRGILIGGVTDSASRHDSPLLAPTLDHASESVGGLPEWASVRLAGLFMCHPLGFVSVMQDNKPSTLLPDTMARVWVADKDPVLARKKPKSDARWTGCSCRNAGAFANRSTLG